MKFKLLIFSLLINYFSFGKEISLVLSYNTFYSEKGYTYFELYYLLDPTSLELIQEGAQNSGAAEVTVTFSKDDEIITYDKLLIAVNQDTGAIAQSILQQSRLRLDTGTYDFKLIVRDVNSENEPVVVEQKLSVEFDFEKAHFSSPQFLTKFEKTNAENEFSRNGYDIYPMITLGTPYIDDSYDNLSFYSELYNIDKRLEKEEPFLISFYLRNENTGDKIDKYSSYDKATAEAVTPILKSFNISKLQSGNYSLILEARNKENIVICKDSTFFYRVNPINRQLDLDKLESMDLTGTWVEKLNDYDTIYKYIDCLYPISSQVERLYADNQLNGGNIENMKRYFLSYWNIKSPNNPKEAWLTYYKSVLQIDRKYRTSIMPGYRTSRGRVFLQYGAPFFIESSISEPGTYPYEIWQYDQLESASTNYQVNRIFVFVNYMVGSNDYELAHSDAVGEVYDPKWRVRINKRDFNSGNIDDQNISPFGQNSPGSRYNNNIILGGSGR
jgi:GWxTD domain-containing protein